MVSLLRLLRARGAWFTVLGVAAIVIGAGWVKRSRGGPHAVDHAVDLVGALAVPLVAYALVGGATGGRTLAGVGRSLVQLGASRARVATSSVAVAMLAAAALSGVIGAAVVAAAHGATDPPLARDALQTLGLCALGGGAYAALFLACAAYFETAWARGAVLVFDAILGDDDGLGAAFTPRAHLRSLLGGDGPFGLAPRESFAVLFVLAILFAALAIRRAARARD